MGKKIDLIIVAGPSGVGKSTMVEKICQEIPQLHDVITYTTRSMRKGESEGQPYHFVTEERFEELVKDNYFVEWARVHDNLYGTPKQQIDQAIADGKVVIMDIDIQGAAIFRERYPACYTFFVLPPSIDELRHRIKKRGRMDETELATRLENARKEMAEAGKFDTQIINADFDRSFAQFKKVIEEILKNR